MKPVKRNISIYIMLAAMLLSIGCTRGQAGSTGNYGGGKGPQKIGVVLAAAGQSQAGTNEAVTAGLKKAAEELDASYRALAPKDLVNNRESLRYLAENGYDLVVAIGPGMEEDLKTIAPEYADIKFVMFDGEVEASNVASVRIDSEEGAFLAGVEAALLTKSNIVGYIGGSLTSDRQLETGYAKGVQYINTVYGKKVRVNATYAGVTAAAANDPERGRTLAYSLYGTGADVLYSGTGRLGYGVIPAAVEYRKFAIGSDSQMLSISPWNVPGTVTPKLDMVAYSVAKRTLSGNFMAGHIGFGISEGAVVFQVSQSVGPDIAGQINAVIAQLKKGQMNLNNIRLPKDLITRIEQMPVDMNKPQTGVTPGRPGAEGRPGGVRPGSGSPARQPGSSGTSGDMGGSTDNPGGAADNAPPDSNPTGPVSGEAGPGQNGPDGSADNGGGTAGQSTQ